MEKMKITKHMTNDRMERYMYIATHMGFGEVVDEFYEEDKCICITSTGILIVKSADKKTVITMFIAKAYQIIRLYGSREAVPIHLLNVSKDNELKGRMYTIPEDDTRKERDRMKRKKAKMARK